MSLLIKRLMTGFFKGHWSLLTTINGGLAGMVQNMLCLSFCVCDCTCVLVGVFVGGCL